MSIDFLLIFFIARYLRKSINTKELNPEWDLRLKWTMYVSIGLFVAGFFMGRYTNYVNLLAYVILVWCMYLLFSRDIFKPAKQILIAIAPYTLVSFFIYFIKIFFPGFLKDWETIIESLEVFAILWGVGVWIVTARQRKALEKAQRKVVEEKKNNELISAMKAELEVQVAERTAELTKQKEELEFALHELKSAQAQLIQAEKMASLGELTAGIAHEIQNPLNFVNNFSEVNTELISELVDEVEKGNTEEVKYLAFDIKENSKKINHHGKRAGDIVKGMLQHSRTSSGQKEPTDINALCDEYLRLAYHGLRAKDKSFNAKFETDFDETLPKINVVSQDIGRVILNLITNAFYAVSEKKALRQAEGDSYEPTVTVSTRKAGDKVEVKVKDNGNGIPDTIKEKIFQPFFTTKPTGSGTGLGLSLSYDIIKAHGGKINVKTKNASMDGLEGQMVGRGEGTEFTVQLPVA